VIEYDATINGVITAADPAHRKFTLLDAQRLRVQRPRFAFGRVDVLHRELLAVQRQRPGDRPVAAIPSRLPRGFTHDEGENGNPEDAHVRPILRRQ